MQYFGKDVVTEGALLHLNRDLAWQKLRSRAKQGIRKARRAGVRMVESRDLSLLAKVWYDPGTLTDHLEENQRLFFAYIGDKLAGGILVTPVTPNTLFYHFGGTNELGRRHEVNAYLFWHIVETFNDSEYEYLDVGVSYREELQHYFQKYSTQSYPILFHPPPPDVCPAIRVNPFSAENLHWEVLTAPPINTQLLNYFEADFTFFPSGLYALGSALHALELKRGAEILVKASIGLRSYVSDLVDAFGNDYRFVTQNDGRAGAVLVAHRWGIPDESVEEFSQGAIPLVEDCRDTFDAAVKDSRVGSFGVYAVFDFARLLPVQFGGILLGGYFDDREIWDRFHCLDVTKRNVIREQLLIHWPRRDSYAAKRLENWRYLKSLFRLLGMKPVDAQRETATPAVFLLQCQEPYLAHGVAERLEQFGVHVEFDEAEQVVALPCHAGLAKGQLDYIFGAFRGMVNPCHSFRRKAPVDEA
jgi:hypothetical protein